MKDKQYYIGLWEKLVEKAVVEHKKEYGNDDIDTAVAVEEFVKNDFSPEEIVGYYLYYYGEFGYDHWIINTKGTKLNDKEKKVGKLFLEVI